MNTESGPIESPSAQAATRPWYRESAMIVVIGVLMSTFLVSGIIVTLAVSSDDPLVISEQEYQELKNEMRGTNARELDNDDE